MLLCFNKQHASNLIALIVLRLTRDIQGRVTSFNLPSKVNCWSALLFRRRTLILGGACKLWIVSYDSYLLFIVLDHVFGLLCDIYFYYESVICSLTAIQLWTYIYICIILNYSSTLVSTSDADASRRGSIFPRLMKGFG